MFVQQENGDYNTADMSNRLTDSVSKRSQTEDMLSAWQMLRELLHKTSLYIT